MPRPARPAGVAMLSLIQIAIVGLLFGSSPANSAELNRRDSVPVNVLGQNAVRVDVNGEKGSFPVILITAPISGLPQSCQVTATANEAGTPTPFTYIAKNCTGSLTATPIGPPIQVSSPPTINTHPLGQHQRESFNRLRLDWFLPTLAELHHHHHHHHHLIRHPNQPQQPKSLRH
ncbi:hypothetical protein HDK77DRAFT_164124 [Phyllosticta capitalensis]